MVKQYINKKSNVKNNKKLNNTEFITTRLREVNTLIAVELLSFIVGILTFGLAVFLQYPIPLDAADAAQDIDFNKIFSISILIGIVFAYITDRIIGMLYRRNYNKKLDVKLDEIVENINENVDLSRSHTIDVSNDLKHRSDCRYIGGKDDGLEYLATCLGKAKKVYNTFISYGLRDVEIEPLLFSDNALDSISKAFLDMLKRENTLVSNLVTIDAVKFPQKINDKIKDAKDGEINGSHLVGILKENIPIINFTILEYSDKAEDKEVIFGWGHHKHDWTGSTFSSGDPHVINMFMYHYKCLSKTSLCHWTSDIEQNLSEVKFKMRKKH